MARLIKYMGKSDVRTIKKGNNFGGQLRDATEADLVFNRENNWIVDVEELGLSDEAVDLLLAEQEKGSAAFKDVSDLKKIPLNAHQKTFLPSARAQANDVASEDEPITTARSVSESATAGGDEAGGGGTRTTRPARSTATS